MRWEGSYTVEATFVAAICVWTLTALCYTGFFIHDNLLLESESNEQTAAWLSRGSEDRTEWEKNLKKTLQKKLFLMQIKSVTSQKGLSRETVKIRYTLPISWKKLKTFLAGKKTSLVYEAEREAVCPARYKWDYDALVADKTTDHR